MNEVYQKPVQQQTAGSRRTLFLPDAGPQLEGARAEAEAALAEKRSARARAEALAAEEAAARRKLEARLREMEKS